MTEEINATKILLHQDYKTGAREGQVRGELG